MHIEESRQVYEEWEVATGSNASYLLTVLSNYEVWRSGDWGMSLFAAGSSLPGFLAAEEHEAVALKLGQIRVGEDGLCSVLPLTPEWLLLLAIASCSSEFGEMIGQLERKSCQ